MNWKLAYLRHAVNHWQANVCYLGECNDTTLFIGITGAYFWLLDFYSMCAKHFIWDIVCSETNRISMCDCAKRPPAVPCSIQPSRPTADSGTKFHHFSVTEQAVFVWDATAPPGGGATAATAHDGPALPPEQLYIPPPSWMKNALMHLIPKRSQVMWSDGVEQPNDQHRRCRVRYLYKSG